MRMKNGLLAAIAGLAALPSASGAAILETIINDDATVGSITFPTLTGSSDVGVVFSLDGFTQADITSISWSLDSSTHDVVTLNIAALLGDSPCPNDGMACSNTTLIVSPSVAKQESMTCGVSGCNSLGDSPEDLSFAPTAAPELSSWAMMIAGFAGLAYAGHWRGRRLA